MMTALCIVLGALVGVSVVALIAYLGIAAYIYHGYTEGEERGC